MFSKFCYDFFRDFFGRKHRAIVGTVDTHKPVVGFGCADISFTHLLLEVEVGLVDVGLAVQIVAVLAGTVFGKTFFGKRKRHVEENIEVGTRNLEIVELKVENPVEQLAFFLLVGNLGALETDV